MTFTTKDTQKCKGFAILIMLFHHLYLEPARYDDFVISFAPFPEFLVVHAANFMKICVGIYVFLSAYGLTLSYNRWKGSDVKFVVYRYFKTMMTFFAVYVLAIAVSLVLDKNWNVASVYELGEDAGVGAWAAFGWAMVVDFLGFARLFGTPTFNGTWWYMSLAIMLIVLLPLLFKLHQKIGTGYMVILATVLPPALGLSGDVLIRYLLCIVLGIACARADTLGKVKAWYAAAKPKIKIGTFAGMTLLLLALFLLRQGTYKGAFIELWDSIAPVVCIFYLFLFIHGLPGIGPVLSFFGKYSTLIFLTHTFYRAYWFRSIAYGFESAWLNYGLLIVVATVIAVVIDLLLKAVRYQKLERWVLDKVMAAKF